MKIPAPALVLALSIACSLALTGCGKKATPEVSAEDGSAHFEAVHAKLDLGGEVYAYLDIEGDLQKLAKKIGDFMETMAESQNDEELPEFFRSSDNWTGLLKELGLDRIVAAGVSSVGDGDQFLNKLYLHLPEGRTGLLEMLGGEPHPFALPAMAPADADLVVENDLNLKALMKVVEQVMSHFPEEKDEFVIAMSQEIPGTGMKTRELIGKLDTRLFIVGRVDPENSTAFPGAPFELPAVDLAIGLHNAAWLFEILGNTIPADPENSPRESTDAFDKILGPDMFQNPRLRPVLYHDKKTGNLFLATSDLFLGECLGEGAKLAGSDAYTAAMAGLPENGNTLSYTSPRLFATIGDLFDLAMSMNPGAEDQAAAAAAFQLMGMDFSGVTSPITNVTVNEAAGVYSVARSFQSHKGTLLMAANPAMIAVLGSVAMPAYSKISGKAKSTKEVNNVRQILLACRMHAIDHDGSFPESLDDLTPDYLNEPLQWTDPKSGVTRDYVYYPGSTDTSDTDTIIVHSPKAVNGEWIVGFADGSARPVRDQAFQMMKP